VLSAGHEVQFFDPSPVLGTGETTAGVLHPVLGSPVPGRDQHTGASLLKALDDD